MRPSPAAATCTAYRRSFRLGACGSTRPAPRRACSPTPGRSAASEVRAFRLRRNEPHSVLRRRSRQDASIVGRAACSRSLWAVELHRFRHLASTAVSREQVHRPPVHRPARRQTSATRARPRDSLTRASTRATARATCPCAARWAIGRTAAQRVRSRPFAAPPFSRDERLEQC